MFALGALEGFVHAQVTFLVFCGFLQKWIRMPVYNKKPEAKVSYDATDKDVFEADTTVCSATVHASHLHTSVWHLCPSKTV